jgi:translation initiation factor 2B subunit (eIF-2B alpha/beta/delta family)
MTREEKVHQIADQMQELLRQPGVEMYLVPDAEHTVLIHGRVNLLLLAEWVLARTG